MSHFNFLSFNAVFKVFVSYTVRNSKQSWNVFKKDLSEYIKGTIILMRKAGHAHMAIFRVVNCSKSSVSKV